MSTATGSSIGVTMQESGGMSVTQNTLSADLNSPSSISNISKQSQPFSVQPQIQSSLLVPHQYASHNITPTGTPPPASPSLQAQQMSLNLMDHTAMSLASQNMQPAQLSIHSNSSALGIEQNILAKDEKSDEEKKNDLINEKLFKINSFQGSKSQAPARQKSIEKGDGQKNKSKKIREKQQTTITLLRDSGDEGTVIGNMSTVIKQEATNDSISSHQIQSSFGTNSSNNGHDTESIKYELSSYTEDNATLMVNNGIKAENFSFVPGERSETGKSENNGDGGIRYSINVNSTNQSTKTTNEGIVRNNEFVVPGNMALTSRNENSSIRKKVSLF